MNRVVLYREECREIIPEPHLKKNHSRFYIVEISRTKRKLYIIAVKIPKALVEEIQMNLRVLH